MSAHKIGSREWAVERAARRISDALAAADSGGYGRSGWASYIDRTDVEAVLEHREELAAELRRLKGEVDAAKERGCCFGKVAA